MHVIARRALLSFSARHPDARSELATWYYGAGVSRWRNSAELKARYPTASIINSERVVFNICGNKYRLTVRINYVSGTVFIRHIGTHQEYDKIDAETI